LAAEATPLPLQATLDEAPKQSLAALFSLFRERIDRSEQLSIDFHEDAKAIRCRLGCTRHLLTLEKSSPSLFGLFMSS